MTPVVEDLSDYLTELAAIERDRQATPGQRLARRVEAAIAREPDAADVADQLRAVLAGQPA